MFYLLEVLYCNPVLHHCKEPPKVHQTDWYTKSETLAYLFRQARVLCTHASCLWCRRHSSGCNAPILPMRTNSRTCMYITGLKYRQACFLSLAPPPQLRLQRPHSPHEDQLPYLHVQNRVKILKYWQACFLSQFPPQQLWLQRPHSPHEDQLPYLHVHNRVKI
jgi:hypothetical protein